MKMHPLFFVVARLLMTSVLAMTFCLSALAKGQPSEISVGISAKEATALDQRFQQIMTQLVENGEFSGSAIFAVNGKPVSRFSGGPFNRQGKTNQLSTLFNIGSVGKLFTQALVLRRVSEGKLKLDEPISTYLQGTTLPNADKVTLRQLMNHTSGYGNYFNYPNYSLEQKTLAEFLTLARTAPTKFSPGEGHFYSNTAFWVLAAVLEAVDPQNRSWPVQYRDIIAKPLNVTLHFIQPDENTTQRPDAFYLSATGEPSYVPPSEEARPGPDGGIYMSVEDLFKVQQALIQSKLYPETMLKESIASPYNYPGLYCDVGLVWELCPQTANLYRTKGGTTTGGGAVIADTIHNRNNYSLVLLSNYHNTPLVVYQGVFEALFKPGKPLPKQRATKQLWQAIESDQLEIGNPQQWWETQGLFTNFSSLPLVGLEAEKNGHYGAAKALYELNLLHYPNNRLSERLLERVNKKISMDKP